MPGTCAVGVAVSRQLSDDTTSNYGARVVVGRGRVKDWFKSYLTGRSYCIIYGGGKTSSTIQVLCSVPQGSVSGPSMFILYTAELAALASKFGVKLYAFADDNQLHVHCDIGDIISSVNALEECITGTAIGQWMSANRLKLNAEKN